MAKVFLDQTVYAAAQERIALVFDAFETVEVSVSSGKDSTVLYHLALAEARRRNRKIGVFFLDQEAEYAASISVIEQMMTAPDVVPLWYQVPIKMTNATSFKEEFLYAWEPGATWMREKNPLAIHELAEEYPQRFYDFFQWREKQARQPTAFLIGLRAEESLNRFRSVVKNPGWNDVKWSTKTGSPSSFRFYPIYDWSMGDVWKFIDDEDVPYNQIYDKMFAANHNYYNTLRVSNLIHEKSFSCLTYLQELEPSTFDALIKRLAGTHTASIYAREGLMFAAKTLPASFSTWLAYRDYLLETTPTAHKDRFVSRFSGQEQSEEVYRQQVRQIMINDFENSVPPVQKKRAKKKADLAAWWDIL
jgi:predicted phosphoadenosine phosphosulfate sulfurtransferase